MSNNLYHHGVIGMKWGVRRARGSSSSTKPSKRNISEDAKEAARISKKHVSEMSNNELRKLNDRINLEQQYSRLNPSFIKTGAKAVATAAIVTNTLVNLYDKSDRLIKIGQKLVGKFAKK
mgnify:CR=1 FL=1